MQSRDRTNQRGRAGASSSIQDEDIVGKKYDLTFKGLENKGENNCFINVVIQSLWHLASFRNTFVTCKHHRHSDNEIQLR